MKRREFVKSNIYISFFIITVSWEDKNLLTYSNRMQISFDAPVFQNVLLTHNLMQLCKNSYYDNAFYQIYT